MRAHTRIVIASLVAMAEASSAPSSDEPAAKMARAEEENAESDSRILFNTYDATQLKGESDDARTQSLALACVSELVQNYAEHDRMLVFHGTYFDVPRTLELFARMLNVKLCQKYKTFTCYPNKCPAVTESAASFPLGKYNAFDVYERDDLKDMLEGIDIYMDTLDCSRITGSPACHLACRHKSSEKHEKPELVILFADSRVDASDLNTANWLVLNYDDDNN